MTDSNLMDANCIHGLTWWECDDCDNLLSGESIKVVPVTEDGVMTGTVVVWHPEEQPEPEEYRTFADAMGYDWAPDWLWQAYQAEWWSGEVEGWLL